eukprot:g30847.t1
MALRASGGLLEAFGAPSRCLKRQDQEQVAAQLRRELADVEQKKEQLRARASEGDTDKPLVLICKPAGLGDLMNSLMLGTVLLRSFVSRARGAMHPSTQLRIQQLEYPNFSASMRCRVEQERMMKTILASFQEAKPKDALPPPPPTDLEVVDIEIDESRVPAGPPEISTLSVTVPEGCEAGSQISITVPDGQQISVTVPGGLTPGMSFEVPCCRPAAGYGGGYGLPRAPPGY